MNDQKKIHLHVVDDEVDLQMIFKLIYKKEISSGQLELSFSTSGKECLAFLEAAQAETIDYILTDINMPDMNGIELIQNVNKKYPNLNIFVASAYDREQYASDMEQLNILNFITKPIDFEKLKKTIGL